MFLIRRVFPLLALFVFASGSTRRGLALSNGEGLLGNNEKSVPSVRPSSVDNLILSAAKDASEERDALEEKQMPIKYNPEAIYNHIVNVKVPHHREKFDRIAKHFPIWENSLQHVQKKLYEGSLRTAALKMASMNASELQVENVNDYVVNTREDIYFFCITFSLYDLIQRTEKLGCDLVTKGCLEWGGLNMRFHLLNRKTATQYMKSSLSLYGKLLKKKVMLNVQRPPIIT